MEQHPRGNTGRNSRTGPDEGRRRLDQGRDRREEDSDHRIPAVKTTRLYNLLELTDPHCHPCESPLGDALRRRDPGT